MPPLGIQVTDNYFITDKSETFTYAYNILCILYRQGEFAGLENSSMNNKLN